MTLIPTEVDKLNHYEPLQFQCYSIDLYNISSEILYKTKQQIQFGCHYHHLTIRIVVVISVLAGGLLFVKMNENGSCGDIDGVCGTTHNTHWYPTVYQHCLAICVDDIKLTKLNFIFFHTHIHQPQPHSAYCCR